MSTCKLFLLNIEILAGNSCNTDDLRLAKFQLADIQTLLVQCNHKSQAKRRSIMLDAANAKQLSQDKKLLIIDLAKKQRSLMGAFKKYKSLVQRIKAVKYVKNNTSWRFSWLLINGLSFFPIDWINYRKHFFLYLCFAAFRYKLSVMFHRVEKLWDIPDVYYASQRRETRTFLQNVLPRLTNVLPD